MYTHHFYQLRCHCQLDFHFLAGNPPLNCHKLKLQGMVLEWHGIANEATVYCNGDGENFLGHVNVVLCLGTSLALIYFLGLNYLIVSLIRRASPFKISSGGKWIFIACTW